MHKLIRGWSFLLAVVLAASAYAEISIVGATSVWKVLDDGSDQGIAWRAPSFNDAAWSSGPAQLGYGDGDESTIVGFGPNPNDRFITTYFRQTFTPPNPASLTTLRLRVIRDDGAIVFINGAEVWRNNMPAGAVNFQTLASTAIGNADESAWQEIALAPAVLVAGLNTIAVEIHQASSASSDISFALELLGNDQVVTPKVTRGPYLQMGTQNSIVVRWRTDIPSDSRVRYGTTSANLATFAGDATITTEHEVRLTGLTPRTKYFYSIGTSLSTIAGGDANHTFLTAPPKGDAVSTRIWVVGDSGTGGAGAHAVRDAFYTSSSTPPNLWLMLGDNAYDSGTDAEYQSAVFNTYPEMLRTSVLWPTIGNHDTANSTASSTSYPYYGIFTLPTHGEAGGASSGTESYYSFDYGNIHFICLDSMTSNRSPLGPMLTWLRSDLDSTNETWIIAFWHHPPYSKGSHDSDSTGAMIEMRENVLPILEAAGVDLVLTGHSHSYERSYLIDGHYGSSNSFVSSMKVDGGNGRDSGAGVYRKPSRVGGPHEGAVYAVTGSAALTGGGPLDHPAMLVSLNQLGSMVLRVSGTRLDASFLRETGAIADSFTIVKGTPLAAPTSASATTLSAGLIVLRWLDRSTNEDGFRIERCTGASCSDFVRIADTARNVTGFIDRGLSAGTAYRYRIVAFNSFETSAASNTVGSTTLLKRRRR
jgi:hypothetical protein